MDKINSNEESGRFNVLIVTEEDVGYVTNKQSKKINKFLENLKIGVITPSLKKGTDIV